MLVNAYYLLKVILCSGILYSYYLLALRNKRFHQYNRWYLLFSTALSFIIPLIKIEFWKEVPPTTTMSVITIVNKADAYVAKREITYWSWDDACLIVFILVSAIFLLSLIVSTIKIFILIKNNPKKVWQKVCFVFSTAHGTPFSFFTYIFWNTAIDVESEAGKHILKHELVHVHEKHSADKLFLSLALVVGWLNPFLWLIRKELNLIHEFIADEKTIAEGDAHSFATMLLNSVYPQHLSMLSNSFFYSPIKRRLLMLTTKKKTSNSYLRRLAILPLLSIVFLFFAFKTKDKKISPSAALQQLGKAVIQTSGRIYNTATTDDTTKVKKRVTITTDNKEGAILFTADSFTVSSSTATAEGKVAITGINKGDTPTSKKPYLIVDGKPIPWQEFDKGNSSPENIDRINVLKDKAATDKYGENGKNGVVEIFTKSAEGDQLQKGDKISYDKVFTKVENPASYKGTPTFADYINANLRYPADALNKGIKGKVIIKFHVDEDGNTTNIEPLTSIGYGLEKEAIRLIKNSSPWNPAVQNGRKVVFEVKQEINFKLDNKVVAVQNYQPAQFPGGLEAWKRYLLRNADLKVLAKNDAPIGTYAVVVNFNVGTDGSISSITTEENPGYGTGEEAIKLVSKGPKWQPAKKDGSTVVSQVKQTISFTVTKEGPYVTVPSIGISRS